MLKNINQIAATLLSICITIGMSGTTIFADTISPAYEPAAESGSIGRDSTHTFTASATRDALSDGANPPKINAPAGDASTVKIKPKNAQATTTANTKDTPSNANGRSAGTAGFQYYEQLNSAQKSVYNALKTVSTGKTTLTVPIKETEVVFTYTGKTFKESRFMLNDGSLLLTADSKKKENDILYAVQPALSALAYDSPEFFWLRNRLAYGLTYQESDAGMITGEAIGDGTYRWSSIVNGIEIVVDPIFSNTADLRARMNAKVSKIASEAKKKNSTYEQLTYVHDWLCNNNVYNGESVGLNNPSTHEAFSALLDEYSPTCEGYAKAFKLICDELNIPCILVVGKGNGGNHMWNYVRINEQWYAVDVTWDDQKSGIKYKYFLKGATSFTDHTPEGEFYPIPDGAPSDWVIKVFTYPTLSSTDFKPPASEVK